ncbi:MAG: metalloprotease PmbA [Pseudomonadota bacterium]
MTNALLAVHDDALAELLSPVEHALSTAQKLGATQAEAGVSLDTGLSTSVRFGEVETLEHHRDRGLVVTVYRGQRKGSASSADTSADAVQAAVEKACSIARFTAEDPCAGLAPAERMATSLPDLNLHHRWDISTDTMIDLASRCEEAARRVDARIDNSEGASVNTHERRRVYGNTHGLLAGYTSSYHSMSCSVIARDGDGMQRDYWYTSARDPDDLDTPEQVGRTAGERTVARLGATKLSTREAPVVFVPALARGLVGHLLGALRGAAQYRRSSFLLDAEGEQVLPEFMTLSEHPHILKGVGSTGMDAEGVATVERDLVRDGVIQGYILGSYSARKLGRETTANAGGVHNVLVSGQDGINEQSLVAGLDRGLLVTELLGQSINPTTGDYSRGAAGFWVENGKRVQPVHEITIAGNLRDMYRGLVAVGDDADIQSNIRCGAMLLDSMTIAGN